MANLPTGEGDARRNAPPRVRDVAERFAARVPAHVQGTWSALEGNLECKGLCEESCGPWVCTPEEGALIKQAAGKPVAVGPVCPYLEGGRCGVYEVRPTICRLWGQVESMPCRFGCKPKRVIPDAEAEALVMELGDATWSPWPDREEYHRRLNALVEETRRRRGGGGGARLDGG